MPMQRPLSLTTCILTHNYTGPLLDKIEKPQQLCKYLTDNSAFLRIVLKYEYHALVDKNI